MYESETMSQILKRTKKCCAKLFRKITFNTPTTTNIPIRIRNQSAAKYVQQKNRIEKQSPENSLDDLKITDKIISRKMFPTDDTASSFDGVDDEYQMFHISPKLFTKHNPPYLRVDDKCKKKNLQDNNISLTPKNKNKLKSNKIKKFELDDDHPVNEIFSITTEDENCIRLNENRNFRDQKTGNCNSNDNNNNSNNNADAYYRSMSIAHHSNGKQSPIDSSSIITKTTSNRLNFSGNDNIICHQHKNQTTSFIIGQNFLEKFDSCLNLTENNLRTDRTKSNIQFFQRYNGDLNCSYHKNDYENKQTISLLDETAMKCWRSQLELYNYEEIIFEKVKYDKTKKYLRHTPSTSTVGSSQSSPKSIRNDNNIVRLNNSQLSLNQNENIKNNFSYLNKTNELKNDNQNINYTKMNYSNLLDENFNRISKSNDSMRIFYDDPWDVFDNKMNKAKDKKLLLNRNNYNNNNNYINNNNSISNINNDDSTNNNNNKYIHSHNQCIDWCTEEYYTKTSPKSSSTTLETWLDDEIFENSFNEELERRCVSFER